MKKFLLMISLFILTLSFASCSSECVHQYGDWTVVKAATCSEEGVHIRVCSLCSAEEVLTVPNTLHAEIIDPEVLPTCESYGLTEGKHCDLCGLVIEAQVEIEPTGHNMSSEELVREATCTEEGEIARICIECGYSENIPLEKIPHEEIQLMGYPATCKKTGLSEGVKCGVCGTFIVEQTVLETVDHYKDVSKGFPSTCTNRGVSDEVFCRYCGKVFEEREILPLADHTPVTDKGYPATETSEGLTDGEHCSVCNVVLVPQTTIPKLGYSGPEFSSGYITKKTTTVITKHLKITIDPNVYVPDHLVEVLDVFTDAVEKVSGLSFAGNPNYVHDLTPVTIGKVEGNESELAAPAYASSAGAYASSGDLLDLSTVLHEAIHVLQFRNSAWAYCTWAMEGITTYTKYKVSLYVEENYPGLGEYMRTQNNTVGNYRIPDYNELYSHSMEYWMSNTLTGGNGNYSIGFRLMYFLDQTYGNYTKWITEFEESYPKYVHSPYNDSLAAEKQLQAFYMVYGEDVFDRFYAWLKENEDLLQYRDIDLRGAKAFNVYPFFYYSGNEWAMRAIYEGGVLYKDLYIGLDAGREYLTEYKHKTIGKLTLKVNDGVTVKLFSSDGTLIKTVDGSDGPIDLTGASYIQLVGEGKITKFEITGYR